MNSHAEKTQENKSQSVSNSDSQLQSGGESTFQFVDNRTETIAQRKLVKMADNRRQVSQMRSFQQMSINSSQTKQTNSVNSNYRPRTVEVISGGTIQRFPIHIMHGGNEKILNSEADFYNLLKDVVALTSEEVKDLHTKIEESKTIEDGKKHVLQDALRVSAIHNRVKTFREMRDSDEHFAEVKKDEDYFTAMDEVNTEKTTRFKNFFYADKVKMIENYRDAAELGKKFFASDAFFDQLASANKQDTDEDLLKRLPKSLPAVIVRANIDNSETKETLNATYGDKDGEYLEEPGTQNFQIVISTPNGAATAKILDDFNAIQRVRGIKEQVITNIIITRADNSWSINFKIE